MDISGSNMYERMRSLAKYSISDPPVRTWFATDFTIKLPFDIDIYMAIKQYNDEWTIFVLSHNPNKVLIQAVVYADNNAELQYVNNHKDDKIIPVRGGGNLLLDIWDWFAKLIGIFMTRVIDMSHLYLCNIVDDLIDPDCMVSLRFLSMILDYNNLSWYERHGYCIASAAELEKNLIFRNTFFNFNVACIMPAIKHEIDECYEKIVKYDISNYTLPYLIKIYMRGVYNTDLSVKEFLAKLWRHDVVMYSVLEKTLFETNDKIIDKYLTIIRDSELSFVKYH